METTSEFESVHIPSEKSLKIAELARRYHEETEAYDRTICTGPIGKDGITAASLYELRQINKHAIKLREKINAEAQFHGISQLELQHAISHYIH